MIDSNIVKTISKKELDSFINNIIKKNKYDIIGVKEKGNRYVFGPLDSTDDLCLDYDVTILPPKKYFLPQYETLMDAKLDEPFAKTKIKHEKPMIIIGIHPYDLIALQQTDKVYLDSQKDDFYKNRRENAILIGVDIQKLHDKSFTVNMDTHVTQTGFDLLLTNIGKKYTVTIGSKKGENLLKLYANTKDSSPSDLEKIKEIRNNIKSQNKRLMKIKKEDWSKFLVANYNNPIWDKKSEKCMECSSCTLVCPTCFCYDISDEVSINLKTGNRKRTWDGCLLRDFTLVGGGEVFREDLYKRYRHRFFRKGNYLSERYGFVACVGCGRCGIACLPDIADPCELINDLSFFEKSDEVDKFFIKQTSEELDEEVIHIPNPATIVKKEKLTSREMLFRIKLDDNKSLNHKPGQFVEVSLFGIGEAPISIASSPDEKTFDLVVRKVGNVTNKLHELKNGDKIGIRGPLGNGFDLESLKGKDILFIAAGLGLPPLRSLITYVLDSNHRKDFGKVFILCGCKEPCEVLYDDEIEKWNLLEDVTVLRTVDKCPEGECWEGDIGLITKLIPKANFDSNNTNCIIVGPPVVYPYCIQILRDLGVPEDHIIVSLERRMKCGVGKCGHCQINGVYCCKEGPVFRYDKIKNLPEAFE